MGSPCPTIAICRSNPCKGEVEPMKDINEIIATCSKDDDCGGGSCQKLIGETRKGVCCPKGLNIKTFIVLLLKELQILIFKHLHHR